MLHLSLTSTAHIIKQLINYDIEKLAMHKLPVHVGAVTVRVNFIALNISKQTNAKQL